MQNVISVSNLSKSYGELKAIQDISFDVKRGEVFGLLGANGAGKSTTIECALGVKEYDKGAVSILGLNPVKDRKKLFEKVSVQFQESCYQDKIKVVELCQVTASLYEDTIDYNELLEKFNLNSKANSLVSELSGGQRQRLFIILALIPNPEVVFLDELTTGIDTKARRDIWRAIKSLKNKGMTVLLTSHFMDEIEVLCDRICILKEGKIIFKGTVNQAIESCPHDNLEDTYLWYTGEEEMNDEII